MGAIMMPNFPHASVPGVLLRVGEQKLEMHSQLVNGVQDWNDGGDIDC